MGQYYVVFDCGTMGTKTAIYSLDATRVAEAYRENKISYPKPGWAEMDANGFVENVREGVRECISKSGVNPAEIRAITASGIICGIVGIDEEWRPVTPFVSYLDNRAAGEAAYVRAHAKPVWVRESANAIVDEFMPPLILRWFLNHYEGFREKAVKVVNNGPFVLGTLAGLRALGDYVRLAHRLRRARAPVVAPPDGRARHTDGDSSGNREAVAHRRIPVAGRGGEDGAARGHPDSGRRGRHDAVGARFGAARSGARDRRRGDGLYIRRRGGRPGRAHNERAGHDVRDGNSRRFVFLLEHDTRGRPFAALVPRPRRGPRGRPALLRRDGRARGERPRGGERPALLSVLAGRGAGHARGLRRIRGALRLGGPRFDVARDTRGDSLPASAESRSTR